MKAAIVNLAGQAPVYGDFIEPSAGPDTEVIAVSASALTQLTKGRAAGAHYSSKGEFPFLVGVDGTGTCLDGRRVYFAMPEAPFAGMGENTLVKKALCVPLPPSLDTTQAAALADPSMSS